jgi:hypothetical protein
MNERLQGSAPDCIALGRNPMVSKFSIEQPTRVCRLNSDVTRTIVENPQQSPVAVEVVGGYNTNVFVDAGKGRGNTAVTMVDGMCNRVVVWNPDRAPVDIDIKGGGLCDVVIFIPKNDKQSARDYKRRKVHFSDRKMKRERVKIQEYDLENLPRIEDQ